ncbi:hypothetical protein NDI76_09500 [Halogeometricum sp. S1BR25-6]|uniref:Uncharacterized protein n=1 Tax=Halogeometricum salsisoli TaxID=2950536 RepID=A0ABU2GDU2_9EURY|nr:hypothetical protein [Halogeometricum sp. S1BR25-6]MDS0298981.1 hypothetical protein [Halogeometricum sp. S1BR25-6]
MTPDLPPTLRSDAPSTAARDVAETLLEAFYQQDIREECLLRGDVAGAVEAADASTEAMAAVFRAEFPERPPERAERAGRTFARALFVQDEIENWSALRANAAAFDRPATEFLFTDLSEAYDGDVADDPRWEVVRNLLCRVCAETGIDAAYGERQTEFWRQHGQRDENWVRTALEAHRLKVEAMVTGCEADEAAALSECFLSGVKLHDRWSRADRDRDLDAIREIVAAYYHRVFELRGTPPSA